MDFPTHLSGKFTKTIDAGNEVILPAHHALDETWVNPWVFEILEDSVPDGSYVTITIDVWPE